MVFQLKLDFGAKINSEPIMTSTETYFNPHKTHIIMTFICCQAHGIDYSSDLYGRGFYDVLTFAGTCRLVPIKHQAKDEVFIARTCSFVYTIHTFSPELKL